VPFPPSTMSASCCDRLAVDPRYTSPRFAGAQHNATLESQGRPVVPMQARTGWAEARPGRMIVASTVGAEGRT
jgi:hypothetical protein